MRALFNTRLNQALIALSTVADQYYHDPMEMLKRYGRCLEIFAALILEFTGVIPIAVIEDAIVSWDTGSRDTVYTLHEAGKRREPIEEG